MEGKTPVEVYARSWPSPADPPRSLPCRSDGIVSSAQRFHCDRQRIARSPEDLQPDEVGAPRSMKMDTTPSPCLHDAAVRRALEIGKFATPCDLALRLVGGRPAGIATWSAYPSIAAGPINPRIDVMGQEPPPALQIKSSSKFRRLIQADGTSLPQYV
jgi:hypothetical protein